MTLLPPTSLASDSTGLTSEAIHILWIGDSTLAERFISRRSPHVKIAANNLPRALDALRQRQTTIATVFDLIVVDMAAAGLEPQELFAELASVGIDLPVVLLTDPATGAPGGLSGASPICECVVKTADFVYQLLPTFERALSRRELLAAFTKARQGEERLRTIVELQPAVVCAIEEDGRLSAVNRAGLDLFAASGDQVVGRNVLTFVPPHDHQTLLAAVGQACRGEAACVEHSLVRSDGALRPVVTRLTPFPKGTAMAALATFADRGMPADDSRLEAATAAGDSLRHALSEATARLAAASADLQRETELRAAAERSADERLQSVREAHEAECARLNERIEEAASRVHALAALQQQADTDRQAAEARQHRAEVMQQQTEQALQGALVQAEALRQELEAERRQPSAPQAATEQVLTRGAGVSTSLAAVPESAENGSRAESGASAAISEALRAATARCGTLIAESSGVRAALEAADARTRALAAQAEGAQHDLEDMAKIFAEIVERDSSELDQLRLDLTSFLSNVEHRCESMRDRRVTTVGLAREWVSVAPPEGEDDGVGR